MLAAYTGASAALIDSRLDTASTGARGQGGDCLYAGPSTCQFRAQPRPLCETRLRGQIRREALVPRFCLEKTATWGLRKPDEVSIFNPSLMAAAQRLMILL